MINKNYLSLLTNDFCKCPTFNHNELIQNGNTINFEEINCFAQKVIEGSEIGAWCFNCKTNDLYFNFSWLKNLGFTLDEQHMFSYEKLRDMFHPDDLIISDNLLNQHLQNKTNKYECFVRIKNKVNQYVGFLIRGKVLIFNKDNEPLWMFGTQVDITEYWKEKEAKECILNKMHLLNNNLPGFVYQYQLNKDGTDSFPYISENVIDIYGINPTKVKNSSKEFNKLVYPDDLNDLLDSILHSAKNLTIWSHRYRIIHPTKGIRWLEGRSSPIKMNDSIIWHGYIYDDTELQESKENLLLTSKVMSNSQEGIIIVDSLGKIVNVNPSICKTSGYDKNELLGKHISVFCPEDIKVDFHQEIWKQVTLNGSWQGEIVSKRKNGDLYSTLLSVDAVYDEKNIKIKNYIIIYTDITKIKDQEKELTRLANYDFLTNLPNRRLLLDRLDMSLKHAKEYGQTLAICFLDLDDFKPINDNYGHESGDALLCLLSQELLDTVRSRDTVARLGGDEFVIVINEVQDDSYLNNMIERILHVCSKEYKVLGNNVKVSASIGVVVYPTVNGDSDELLRFADQAMYKAKQQGRKRYVFFDIAHEDASTAHYIKLENIRNGFINQQLKVWYQPKIDVRSQSISGFESLIRWEKDEGVFETADNFIHILNGDPLEHEIGHFVLNKVLEEQQKWLELGQNISVSVNISPDHLLNHNFKDELIKLLEKYKTSSNLLTIEILETSKLSNFDIVIQKLNDCLNLGVNFSLDDFGTGYSSLGYLRQLPIQEIKIDKSFIKNILTNKSDQMIVQGIIDLSHALNLKVVAEGVESKELFCALCSMGIDTIQGFWIAPPMPQHLVIPWIESWILNKNICLKA
jgi:diguanylate cyclase (GGDEF)-like protein/PAS domain S-box-containing protein